MERVSLFVKKHPNYTKASREEAPELRKGLQENSRNKQQQSDDLRGPRLAVGSAELSVDEHAQESGDEERSTTQRVADGVAQAVASTRVAEVAQRQQSGGPDGGPALLPGGGEVVLPAALGALERVAHDDATRERRARRPLGEREHHHHGR